MGPVPLLTPARLGNLVHASPPPPPPIPIMDPLDIILINIDCWFDMTLNVSPLVKGYSTPPQPHPSRSKTLLNQSNETGSFYFIRYLFVKSVVAFYIY